MAFSTSPNMSLKPATQLVAREVATLGTKRRRTVKEATRDFVDNIGDLIAGARKAAAKEERQGQQKVCP